MYLHKSAGLLALGLIGLLVGAPPAHPQTWLSGINANTTNNSAIITWSTAVPTTTQVKYGTNTSYGTRTPLNSNLVVAHSAILSGLRAGTSYHFRTQSQDATALQLTSFDYTFTTQAGPLTVTVTPNTVTVPSAGTQQFTATVTNTSNTAVTWSASAGSINASGLFTAPTVTSDQTVTVTATSVANSSKSGRATVTVKAPAPVLAVSPTNMAFSAQQGGVNPGPASLTISNTGGGTFSFTVASDSSWLTVSPASGTAPATLQVGVAIGGLVSGSYTGHLTVNASGANGSPATVTVALMITPPPHSVTLSWNASTSGNVVSYSAYRGSTSGGPYALLASAISSSPYIDSTVLSGTTYYYVVTAIDDTGAESVDSDEARAVVPSP